MFRRGFYRCHSIKSWSSSNCHQTNHPELRNQRNYGGLSCLQTRSFCLVSLFRIEHRARIICVTDSYFTRNVIEVKFAYSLLDSTHDFTLTLFLISAGMNKWGNSVTHMRKEFLWAIDVTCLTYEKSKRRKEKLLQNTLSYLSLKQAQRRISMSLHVLMNWLTLLLSKWKEEGRYGN